MINTKDEVNAVQRTVKETVLADGEARTVTIARSYATGIDDVWDAWITVRLTPDSTDRTRVRLDGPAGRDPMPDRVHGQRLGPHPRSNRRRWTR